MKTKHSRPLRLAWHTSKLQMCAVCFVMLSNVQSPDLSWTVVFTECRSWLSSDYKFWTSLPQNSVQKIHKHRIIGTLMNVHLGYFFSPVLSLHDWSHNIIITVPCKVCMICFFISPSKQGYYGQCFFLRPQVRTHQTGRCWGAAAAAAGRGVACGGGQWTVSRGSAQDSIVGAAAPARRHSGYLVSAGSLKYSREEG